jgi:hypothetical protein
MSQLKQRYSERQERKLAERYQAANHRHAELRHQQLDRMSPDDVRRQGGLAIFVASRFNDQSAPISAVEQRRTLNNYADLIATTREREARVAAVALGAPVVHHVMTFENVAAAIKDPQITDLVFVGQGSESAIFGHRGKSLTAIDLAEMPHDHLKHSVKQYMFGDFPEVEATPLGRFVTLDTTGAQAVGGLSFPSPDMIDAQPKFSLHLLDQPSLDLRRR